VSTPERITCTFCGHYGLIDLEVIGSLAAAAIVKQCVNQQRCRERQGERKVAAALVALAARSAAGEDAIALLRDVVARAESWRPAHHGSAWGAAHDEGRQAATDSIADDARAILDTIDNSDPVTCGACHHLIPVPPTQHICLADGGQSAMWGGDEGR